MTRISSTHEAGCREPGDRELAMARGRAGARSRSGRVDLGRPAASMDAAARLLPTGPDCQPGGRPSAPVTGCSPRIAFVTNTSLASSSSVTGSGPTATGMTAASAVRRTRARITPGRIRPSAAGVRRTPPTTANTFGPVGFQHATVGVGEQQLLVRAQARSRRQLAQQPAVGPLMATQAGHAVRQFRRPQPHARTACGRQAGIGLQLNPVLQRAAYRAHRDTQHAAASAGKRWRSARQVRRQLLAVHIAGAGGQPGQVLGQPVRFSVAHTQGGEDAHRWPRPQRERLRSGTGRRLGLTRGTGRLAVPDPPSMAAISGCALTRHSAYSAAGSDAATMPPPAPSQTRGAANSNVRIATLNSSPASGLRYPIAPV